MGKYQSQFRKAADAKPINNFAKSPALGKHRVALKSFRGKESQKQKEVFIEAEFYILESATEQVGVVRSVPWFINRTGWTGDYASARLQEFLGVVKDSVNAEEEIAELGDKLADEDENSGYGITLDISVEVVMDKDDASKVAKGKNNRDIHNVTWSVVEQTPEDIMATRELLATFEKASPAKDAVKPVTQTQTATPSKLTAVKSKLLGAK